MAKLSSRSLDMWKPAVMARIARRMVWRRGSCVRCIGVQVQGRPTDTAREPAGLRRVHDVELVGTVECAVFRERDLGILVWCELGWPRRGVPGGHAVQPWVYGGYGELRGGCV